MELKIILNKGFLNFGYYYNLHGLESKTNTNNKVLALISANT